MSKANQNQSFEDHEIYPNLCENTAYYNIMPQNLVFNSNIMQFNSSLNDFSFNPMNYEKSQFPFNFHTYENVANQQSKQKEQPISNQLFQIEKKRKKQKYKRSTNNSHKKFISAIRRLFFSVISIKEKQYFQTKYSKYRSCRTFFFIILAYMKNRFSQKLLNSVKTSFINQMNTKISQYTQQINKTKNANLKNFRLEEIIDIKFSIKSCNEYFKGNTRQAIEFMYKKDKSTVVKRQHYESALRSVHIIEKQLSRNPKELLQQPYIEDYSQSQNKSKTKKKYLLKKTKENHHIIASPIEKREENQFLMQNNVLSNEEMMKIILEKTGTNQKSQSEASEKIDQPIQKFLYPPLLQPIPFYQYDPYCPPFMFHNKVMKQKFAGYMNFQFPSFPNR